MGAETKIEWAEATWNPFQGCTKVSPGCDNCYAETLSKRWGKDFSVIRRSSDSTFFAPLRWKVPKRIFTCSVSDFFHQRTEPWREDAWDVMLKANWHTYMILTKRPGIMAYWAKTHHWPDHIWAGTSVETQKYAPRLDVLGRVPAKVRFVSCEPMLGPLLLGKWMNMVCTCGVPQGTNITSHGAFCKQWGRFRSPPVLSWVIIGGESGHNARPFDTGHAVGLIAQCLLAKVPVFVKQMGALPMSSTGTDYPQYLRLKDRKKGGDITEWPPALAIRELPKG